MATGRSRRLNHTSAMAQDSSTSLRPATRGDLADINEIYNHYVLHSTCTYQETPETMAGRREWFGRHGDEHPVVVAEIDGRVVGWGSLSAFHARSAFRRTVEDSIYIHPELHGRGIGSLVLRDLVRRARLLGHRAVVAAIEAEQPASLALHARFQFEHVGRLRQVGFKFGRWLDLIYLELLLPGPETA